MKKQRYCNFCIKPYDWPLANPDARGFCTYNCWNQYNLCSEAQQAVLVAAALGNMVATAKHSQDQLF